MRRIAILIFALASTARAASPSASEAQAAYDAQQFRRCGELWRAVARGRSGDAVGEALYNAACCQALDKDADGAFKTLDEAGASGLRDLDQLKADSDFSSLRSDPRWPKLLTSLEARIAVWEKTLREPALRRELLAMVVEDQAVRMAYIKSGDKDPKRMEAIDRKDTARLKEIVGKYGWPGKSLVGKDGASAAWLLVQHADLEREFQKLCLAKMDPLVKSGEVDAKNWAYLVDRVAVAEKRKQTYGTQFNEKREPQPIEDEAHVDERRRALGMPSMDEYKKMMLKMYGAPK
jgi:hypothetical protein